MEVNIKYFDNNMNKIEKFSCGDWIDLRCIGGDRITTLNAVEVLEGVNVLRRASVKTPILWEDGVFVDENGQTEKVKFFRYEAGEFLMLDLGVAMQLPEGKEAYVIPRGSTFKNFAIIETNSMGIVDNSYRGDNDKWFMPALALKCGFIMYNERICQFRIQDSMGSPTFNELEKFNAADRGSHGSTGTK